MPTVTALPALSLRDLAAANLQSLHRSPGCHVTQVVDAIMAAYGGRTRPKDFTTLDSENWQEAGFVWELILSETFAARQRAGIDRAEGHGEIVRFRPGELTRDGIIGSPDALVTSDTGAWIEEYKCTWKSSKSFDLYDRRYLPWLLQMQAYCVLADVTDAHLYVLHINGGYDGFIPEVAAWHVRFTRTELMESWHALCAMARKQGWIA